MDKALANLRKMLKRQGLETRLEEQSLEVMLAGLGRNRKGAVIFKISRFPADSTRRGRYYSFHTIIGQNLRQEMLEQTMRNLNLLNMRLLLGAYGIIPETGTIVHKYVYRVMQKDADAQAELLYRVFVDLVATVYKGYDQVLAGIAD